MDTNFEDDSWVMAETKLSELLEDEKQRLIFVFDNMTERSFFMELREIVPGKNLDKAICSKSKGNPPTQLMDFEELEITPIPDSERTSMVMNLSTRQNWMRKATTIWI